MQLESDVLGRDGRIPRKYTKDGDNLSPPLHWLAVPDGTAELALIFDVTVENGLVTLGGTAPDWATYQAAERGVQYTGGVVAVNNSIMLEH